MKVQRLVRSSRVAERGRGRGLAKPRALPVDLRARTPHSGFHLDSSRDFFEGWYFRVTLDNVEATGEAPGGQSFALIYSYEQGAELAGGPGRTAVQIMGPGDGYVAQSSPRTQIFWGDRNDLQLGACFKPTKNPPATYTRTMLSQGDFDAAIAQGFQASTTWHQGSIRDSPIACAGTLPASVSSASWAFSVQPLDGWGSRTDLQRSTASWLASLPVFEPHWQVLMAHGLATGYLMWGETMYTFADCPLYAEKNWGYGFPKKWAWVQCNAFPGHSDLSLTAVAAIRSLLSVGAATELVGLIGIHFRGKFIELSPSNATVRWDVEPWGRWEITGKGGEYEAAVEATCANSDGVVLRAPCGKDGLIPACMDTFNGAVRLRVWELDNTGVRKTLVVDAESRSAALETGGGPWWSAWKQTAQMNPAVSLAVQAPVEQVVAAVAEQVPFTLPKNILPAGY